MSDIFPFSILVLFVSRKEISSRLGVREGYMDVATCSWKAWVRLCHETRCNAIHASELLA